MTWRIGTKLSAGFGAILALMLVSAVLMAFRLEAIRADVNRMAEVRTPSLNAARRLQDDMDYVGSKTRQAILAGTQPKRREAAQALFDEAWTRVDRELKSLTELAPKWSHQENRDRLASLKERLPKIHQLQQGTIDQASSSLVHDAVILGGNRYADEITPAVNEVTKTLGKMAQSFEDMTMQDKKDVASANSAAFWTLVITTLLAAAIGTAVALILRRQISSATSAVLRKAEAIAAGDLSGAEVRVRSKDELGELARAINSMHTSLRKVIQSIAETAQNVANASEEFSSVSQQITTNSEETSAQANAVSTATDEVNRNLHTVATATEEMSASISEIAKNATEAAKVAASAMTTANETNTIVTKLGESSAEIGQVIKVITSIAQKTDLLALNATVEAARAGEVGAGFAVVANEVKELAKQTATATEDISRKIEAIQTDAKAAVQAIASISGIIGQVNEISGTIAAAVEEQSATTSEMSRNLTEAAKGAGEVGQNISGVAQAAQNTSHGASDSLKASQQLAQLSHKLRTLVEQFKLEGNSGSSRRPSREAARSTPKQRVEAEEREEVLTR